MLQGQSARFVAHLKVPTLDIRYNIYPNWVHMGISANEVFLETDTASETSLSRGSWEQPRFQWPDGLAAEIPSATEDGYFFRVRIFPYSVRAKVATWYQSAWHAISIYDANSCTFAASQTLLPHQLDHEPLQHVGQTSFPIRNQILGLHRIRFQLYCR